VRYWQDSAGIPGKPGKEGRYVVKRRLTVDEKRSVALAIFIEVSLRFESLQLFVEHFGIGQSGFSQEDLVSDLTGFYIDVGDITQHAALKLCHPVSARAALAIWDREGAVGANKNTSWGPKLAQRTYLEIADQCVDECNAQPRRFPKAFMRIHPATKGLLLRELPRGP
jgi:hypothetical protein